MSQRLARLRSSPLVHVLGFSAFPVVFLWAQNAHESIPAATVLRPLVLICASALAVFAVARVILRDPVRAGLLTSLLLVVFFTFGRMRDVVDPFNTGDRDDRLLILAGVFLVICGAFVVRAGRFARGATNVLNLVAATLVALNVASVAIMQGLPGTSRNQQSSRFELPGVDEGLGEPNRDVYYLIFDRYANVHTLREEYGFDNEPFEDFLRANDFSVADGSIANYPKTVHSLASSLRMDYLDDLAERLGPGSDDWGPLFATVQGSNVVTGFQELGFRYEHVGSWYEPTRIDVAADRNTAYESTEFSSVLLETTLWPTLSIRLGLDATFARRHYEHALFQFDAIERIARDPGPTFTFAHFLLPHPPYVFDADGSFVSPRVAEATSVKRAYLAQLRYTNRRIQELVSVLLSGPESSRPIIVIQSDEGPHPQRLVADEPSYDWTRASDEELKLKLRILNAYYLPGGFEAPYPTISPVNTFRLIFSRYFGADLPLLDDRTFVFRDQAHPYDLTEVTSRLREP